MLNACAASVVAAYVPFRGPKCVILVELSPALVAAENNIPIIGRTRGSISL